MRGSGGCTVLKGLRLIFASHQGTRSRTNFRWPLPALVQTAVNYKSNKSPLWLLFTTQRGNKKPSLTDEQDFCSAVHLSEPTILPTNGASVPKPDPKISYRCHVQTERVIPIGLLRFVNVVFCDCPGTLLTHAL